MKEADWLASSNARHLLQGVRSRLGDRKLRLLACACCRRVWHLLVSECSRRAVAVAERYADGLVSPQRLNDIYQGARAGISEKRGPAGAAAATVAALASAPELTTGGRALELAAALDELARTTAGMSRPGELPLDAAWCADLVRDAFGPAAGIPRIDQAWQTSDVRILARRAYEDRDFLAVALLGDALEDAGCTVSALLDHCRSGKIHGRGCWVVDLVRASPEEFWD